MFLWRCIFTGEIECDACDEATVFKHRLVAASPGMALPELVNDVDSEGMISKTSNHGIG